MPIRTNRGTSRQYRLKPRDTARAKPREVYPVRVKSHDGYVECQSSMLAEISEAALAKKAGPRLHLKLEIGGDLLGKDLAVNYGLPFSSPEAEVNGILVGKREPSRMLILAFRRQDTRLAAARDGAVHPEEWRRAFAGLMARIRWDPKFSGLEPVGWFRAHPKASLNLSERDLDLFNRFFGEPWQIGLVLQPGAAATKGRFFLREADRSIRPETGFQDIVIQRHSDHSRVFVGTGAQSVDSAESQRVGLPPFWTKKSIWPIAAFLAATLGVGAWWTLRTPETSPGASHVSEAAVPDPNQEAAKQAAALWKKWENEAREERRAAPTSANLEVPPLARNPEDEARHETAPPAPATVADRAPIPSSARQAQDPRSFGRSSRDSKETHRTTTPPARKPLTLPQSSVQAKGLARTFIADAHPVLSAPRNPVNLPAAVNPAPPKQEAAPQQPTQSPAARSEVPPPAEHPSPEASAPAARSVQNSVGAAAAPAASPSGRLIWTGRLRKNGFVVIDGDKPSTGSSRGGLPGRPVTFRVSPGDLTTDGMVVYTARPPANGRVPEPPGPQNGWNKTMYEWDPSRAADVEVVEAPGPNNGWKRLVLRAKNPRDSIILVEWKAVP